MGRLGLATVDASPRELADHLNIATARCQTRHFEDFDKNMAAASVFHLIFLQLGLCT